jgi:hypothetical protein
MDPIRLRLRVGAPALVAVLVALVAPASAAASCRHGHDVHVLAHSGHVFIWAKVARHGHRVRDRLYVCVGPDGGAHFLGKEPGRAFPHVGGLQVAGHFVGFFLRTSAPFFVGTIQSSLSSASLIVFDTSSGRVDMADSVGCQGSSCATVPVMTRYFLAPSGWVAEAYEVTDTATANTLRDVIATYAPAASRRSRQSVPLDFGLTISGLKLFGETVTWTSDLGGASSAVLRSSLIPSTTPQAISACQLLTTTDLGPVLGDVSSSGSTSHCEYSSESNPSKTLSLSFKAGLSSQQVSSDASALNSSSGVFPILVNYGGYSMDVRSLTIAGVTHDQLAFFSEINGSELALDLTAPDAHADEQLAWLANVAFDRLFAIPVQRTN